MASLATWLKVRRAFRPVVEVGPLPVAEQTKRPQTQAQREALARLHARRRAEKEDAENERQRRLGGEVGTYTAPTKVAEKITL